MIDKLEDIWDFDIPKHPNKLMTALACFMSFSFGIAAFGLCKKYNLSYNTATTLCSLMTPLPIYAVSHSIDLKDKFDNTRAHRPLIQNAAISCATSLCFYAMSRTFNIHPSQSSCEKIFSLSCIAGLQMTHLIDRAINPKIDADYNPYVFYL